jgi:hypothetical protein
MTVAATAHNRRNRYSFMVLKLYTVKHSNLLWYYVLLQFCVAQPVVGGKKERNKERERKKERNLIDSIWNNSIFFSDRM